MIITLQTDSVVEIEKLLRALKELDMLQRIIVRKPPEEDNTLNGIPFLPRNPESTASDHFGIWEGDTRTTEEIRSSAWGRSLV